jgi:predicted pyridoxine 5'-phosphate oxidase superfamily flavin-nucleotide-binding protein
VQNHLDIQGPAMEGGATILPGSRGEHALQSRFKTRGRAYAFYDRQLLDHLNPLMREFIGQQEMMFIATADVRGECDCSFRAGPPGFVRVLNERQLMYPEYRGNGVMASLGNMGRQSPYRFVLCRLFWLNGRSPCQRHRGHG